MKREVLGVKIDDISRDEAVDFILKNKPHLVFTTGPEFLVTAQNDPEFKKILNKADLNIPDGIGLKMLGGFKNSFAGVDLMLDLCNLASKNKLTVGLFGGREGVAGKTAKVLREKFKGLKIQFAIDGNEADKIILNSTFSIFNSVDFLFVGLGHPKQEKFLYSLCHSGGRRPIESSKKEDPIASLQGNVFKVGMGVGGSFDFISGNLPRPPWLIRQLGLGWLYRGFTKPNHWKRIFNAVIIFPWLIFKQNLSNLAVLK